VHEDLRHLIAPSPPIRGWGLYTMEAKQASLDQYPVSSWGVPRLCEQMYA